VLAIDVIVVSKVALAVFGSIFVVSRKLIWSLVGKRTARIVRIQENMVELPVTGCCSRWPSGSTGISYSNFRCG